MLFGNILTFAIKGSIHRHYNEMLLYLQNLSLDKTYSVVDYPYLIGVIFKVRN